ncbi:hypothetical protein [Streptomyces sp. NPDC056190]|uniref:hypothetical protein n=1 Tax=unclassified Streptomyces TaxID=2593676 RepID=UPI0035DAF98C
MGTETDWVYRVFEPHGSEGWRPYGSDPERWRGTITADDSSEGPQYALSLVVADLMTEWKVRGLHRAKHVRVYLWRDEEGDQEDADAIVEVRPSIHAELPAGDRIRAPAPSGLDTVGRALAASPTCSPTHTADVNPQVSDPERGPL